MGFLGDIDGSHPGSVIVIKVQILGSELLNT